MNTFKRGKRIKEVVAEKVILGKNNWVIYFFPFTSDVLPKK